MREIGSEFWNTKPQNGEMLFFLSGRTALDFIVRDIISERKVKVVYMPSLCCHSMLEPFARHSIPIRFYDVLYRDNRLMAQMPQVTSDDIYFHMNYFGFQEQDMADLSQIRESGCIIIEDSTHSWLSDEVLTRSDEQLWNYRFISYRKWSGFTGIATAQKRESFSLKPTEKVNAEFLSLRHEAQRIKADYLKGKATDKSAFLQKFAHAESILDKNYSDYVPSYQSIGELLSLDKAYIKESRSQNAQVLISGLSGIEGVVPVFSSVEEYDVPLCVPILVDSGARDRLRKFLISKEIYCPIHWPISDLHNGISDIAKDMYQRELSLVCDQRYSTDDMRRILQCITDFFRGDIND